MKGLLVLVSFVWLFCCCKCDSDFQRRQAQKLKSELLENYTSTVAPSSNVQVNISFTLMTIMALEETNQVFRFSASLVEKWHDPWLTWDIRRGVPSLNFETTEIWIPDLFIPNGVGEKISNIPTSTYARAFSNGEIMIFTIAEFETICNLDMTRYPYDEQACLISIMSIFDTQLHVHNYKEVENLFQSYYTGSSEWELLETTTAVDILPAFNRPFINIEFRLRRHSIFYTLSIIFPMCLLSFLNSFVFLLPAASGEKISFLLSIFVSGAVFLNFINDSIPKSSQASRLTIYLVLLLSQSALALLATLLVMNIYHRQGALLCLFRKDRKVKDEGTPSLKEDFVALGSGTDRLDKALFLLFFAMAGVSVLVFYI